MNISDKFKELTKMTYPHGTEIGLLDQLPKGYSEDGLGNYYIEIGESTTMFTCHLDTACKTQDKVTHLEMNGYIYTDGSTILGADDKAGMVVLLNMIKNSIPGLYYFFIGEEVGCIGSGLLAKYWTNFHFSDRITKIISFDRRGTDSIITHQLYGRCCSDAFGKDLSNRLNAVGEFNFSNDRTGVYTDSAEFVDLIQECTNISVGYYNEHTVRETQDIDFLENLCKAVCEIDWESLVVERDPLDYTKWDDSDDFWDEKSWTGENYSYFDSDEGSKLMYISEDRINDEREDIYSWLTESGLYNGVGEIIWNGNELYIDTNQLEFIGNRFTISEYVSSLTLVPMSSLKEYII